MPTAVSSRSSIPACEHAATGAPSSPRCRRVRSSPIAALSPPSSAPSSGTHYYIPAVWDFYTDPANPIQVVHNEEHGGVIIWWGEKVPQSTIAQLRRFYDEQPVSVLGTPIKGLGSKIALTAWTKGKD